MDVCKSGSAMIALATRAGEEAGDEKAVEEAR